VSKRVAAIQSNYVPWKGYFDAINVVDEFILLDEVQFTRRDWRNRNKIKTDAGTRWLTIPVQVKGKYHQRIDETLIAEPDWGSRHWDTLRQAYGRTAHFDALQERIAPLYLEASHERLSDVNRDFIEVIAAWLGITTQISWSTDYETTGERGDRILDLCRAAGADEYVSGPAARAYLDEAAFAEAGVRVLWMDYSGYPEYEQPAPPFEHGVTILDLLCATGDDAPAYMKTFGSDHGPFV
jgi:hypothetical protein